MNGHLAKGIIAMATYSTLLPILMKPSELVKDHKRINAWFVDRRDRRKDASIVYRRLKALETEMSRRRIFW